MVSWQDYCKWRKQRGYYSQDGYNNQRQECFNGGYYIGLNQGLKWGIGLGIVITFLGLSLGNQLSKGLEKNVQTQAVEIEKPR